MINRTRSSRSLYRAFSFGKYISLGAVIAHALFCIIYLQIDKEGNQHNQLFARTVADAVFFVFFLLIANVFKVPRRIVAWLGPLVYFLMIVATAFATSGDIVFMHISIVLMVIVFCFFDMDAFFKYALIVDSLLLVLLLFFKNQLLGPTYPPYAALIGYIAHLILTVILYINLGFFLRLFRELDDSVHTFEAVMKTTPSYLVIINDDAEVQYLSDSLCDFLGTSREYIRGRPLLDIITNQEMQLIFQEVMEEGGFEERNFEINQDGKVRSFLLRSSPMGEGIARLFQWDDVTPIMEAKNEAESAARAKTNFLANMSHEIRTPMNAIIGMTDLMLANPLNREQLTRADTIKSAAVNLLSIINDILDFSKVDAQKMEIIPRSFDYIQLIGDTLNIINVKAAEAGLTLTTDISINTPPIIYADDIRLKQCLINLLNNAVKFTKKGNIELHSWTEEDSAEQYKLFFAVQDTGMGIKESEIGKLFQEFSQLDTHKNRNIVGTGLGLAITRNLVELMGGHISVESVYGSGSVFTFYITCPRSIQVTGGGYLLAAVPRRESLKVLAFESNDYNSAVFRRVLTKLDIAGLVAESPSEARAALASGGFTHVFFDSAWKENFRDFFGMQGVQFIILKNLHDKFDEDVATAITRPVLLTSVADILNGKKIYEKRVRAGADGSPSFMTKDAAILVVDDNEINRMVAEGLLRRYGIEVTLASSGEEAIGIAAEKEFDIIFMDHMMPGMDGLETTQAIRTAGYKAPIIALTANVMTGIQEEFRAAGMDDYLSKPILIKDLKDILKLYLPPEKIVPA